jgi:hypothetical protein
MNDPLMGNIMNYSANYSLFWRRLQQRLDLRLHQAITKMAYNRGITFWIPTYATPIDTYLTTADITWDNAGPLDDKMEMIHLQKYYSLFWTDFEQWFEYRRTGHPVLPKGNGLSATTVLCRQG